MIAKVRYAIGSQDMNLLSGRKTGGSMDSSVQFLSHFKGKEIYATVPDKDKTGKFYHYHDKFKKVRELLQSDNSINRGVFFTVNELDTALDPTRKRTRKMFVRARAIWCEDDNVTIAPRNDWPIPPNLIVNSSPGKYHYYWLTTTDDPVEWNCVMMRLVQDWGCDNQARDLVRVLRIPGFYHNKKEPHLVTYTDNELPEYSWDDILHSFPPLTKVHIEKSEQGVIPGMSVAQLVEEGEHGHQHGPSRTLAMKLANYKLPFQEALEMMKAMLPNEHHDGHHEQSLKSAFDKIAAENDEDDSIELPEIVNKEISGIEWPPGLFGKMCQEAYEMAHYPNKSIAIVTCVGMLAGICGRAYNVSGTGLNLYITLLMGTGMGKDTIGKIIERTIRASSAINGSKFIGAGRFTGPKAIWAEMQKGMSKVSVMTEAGLMNGSTAGDKEGITRTLLSLYTSSGKEDVKASEAYSKVDEGLPELFAPALTIIQESTPKIFIDTLMKSGGDVNGDLGRMWLVKLNDPRPNQSRKIREGFSDSVSDKISMLVEHCSKFQLNSSVELEKVCDVPLPDFAWDASDRLSEIYRDASQSGKEYVAVMATRAWVKSIKIASLISIFNGNMHDPKIDQELYSWVWKNVVEMELNNIEQFISEEDSSDISNVVKIVGTAIIKLLQNPSSGSLNPKIAKHNAFTRTALNNVTKHNKTIKELSARKDGSKITNGLDKVLEHMVEINLLKRFDGAGRGFARTGKCYSVTREFTAIMK